MDRDVEHFFMCFLAMWASSFERQLLSPQHLLLIDNIAEGFLIFYLNNWFGIEFVNLLLLSHISRSGNRNIKTI
jgi:hypothetical protein